MSKKDYKKFAEFWRENRESIPDSKDQESYQIWRSMLKDFADILQADNPNFDRDRFYTACGVDI